MYRVAPLLITMAETERILSLDDNIIRRLIGDGEIDAIKVGRALRIVYVSVVRFVERQVGYEQPIGYYTAAAGDSA